ncbi:MAG TPA: adenylate/guanylate cyclase domain-containing protein [Candidatus Udaeobacter sp.]|nr:adenylate/guanylate cyclase domain-containing protein [Candidatus Udaeobacter sp.]
MAGPRRPRLALRMALTLFVVMSVLGTALLIHVSWSYTARQNVADVAKQLNEQIVASIRTELSDVLRNVQATEEAVRSIFYQGAIAPQDEGKREFIFLALLQSQPVISRIAFGWPTGDFFGTENFDDEIHNVEVKWFDARRPLPAGVAIRRVDRYLPEPGEPLFLDRKLEPSTYSVLRQSWYRKAVKADKTVWTQSADFPDRKQPGINISGSLVLYGNFIGVINVTVELGRLSSFLADQRVGSTGTVAILDSTGNIIASQDPAERKAETAGMMRNLDSLDAATSPLLSVVRQALSQNMLKLSEVKMIQPLAPVRASDGALYYVSLSPANFRDWSVVTVIPEKDFLGNIDRNTQRLLYGVAAFTLMMIVASILLADRLIGRPLIRIAGQLGNIESFHLDRIARVPSALRELDDLSGAIMQMARGLTSFQKYLPTELVRTLVSQGIEAKPGGQQQTLTVLFSDLAGFTTLSERLGPGIVPVLTAYLSAASKAIVEEKGTIDKFIGDAVMAFWGAPLPDERHAEAACRAALACRRAMANLPGMAAGEHLHLRIGINTGPMLVGNVGSEERLNYTVIGDSVNLASRLESLNKVFGTDIIMGEATRLAAGDAILVREVDQVAVYGRMESTAVFELIAMADEKPASEKLAWVAIYEAGLAAYRQRRWPEAIVLLDRVAVARGGEDPPAAALMERCRALIAEPPDSGWRPVTVMGTK